MSRMTEVEVDEYIVHKSSGTIWKVSRMTSRYIMIRRGGTELRHTPKFLFKHYRHAHKKDWARENAA